MVAQSFWSWIEALWEQNGNGLALASRTDELVLAELVLRSHRFVHLKPSAGLGRSLVECAEAGLGCAGFDEALAYLDAPHLAEPPALAALTAPEREFLGLVGRLAGQAERFGVILRGRALGYLAARQEEVFSKRPVVRFEGDEPLSAQQDSFFQRCPAVELQGPETQEQLPLKRLEDREVRMAFPAGGYAQGALILDILKDMGIREQPGSVIIVSQDPLGLFGKLTPALAQPGISCSAAGTVAFGQSDLGQAFLAVASVLEGEDPWERDAISDALHSAVVGLPKSSVWLWDAAVRGDRLKDCASALEDILTAQPEGPLSELVALASGTKAESPLLEQRLSGLRPQGFSAAYCAEQIQAYYALTEVLQAVKGFGVGEPALIRRLMEGVRLSVQPVAANGDPHQGQAGYAATVRIMDRAQAARLPEGSAAAVILVDLDTASFPLKDAPSAAGALLEKLGAGPREGALERARRQFRALLSLGRELVVLERRLNDADGAPSYPCAMLEEFTAAYRDPTCDFPATADEARYGFAEELLTHRYERGEEDLLADLQPTWAEERQLMALEPTPRLGRVDAGFSVAPHTSHQRFPELPRLSASQIQTYIDCPYKWFVTNRLGAECPDEEVGPREVGSFLHEVFQVFYSRFGRKVSRECLAQAEALMFGETGEGGVFAEVLQDQYRIDEQGRPRLSRLALRPSTLEEHELDDLRRRVRQWLSFEVDFLPGFRPVAFECRIEGVTFAGCELSGVIDRIDVDEAGNAVIIDYKGSLDGRYKPCAEGQVNPWGKVQTLLYGQILAQAGGISLRSGELGKSRGFIGAQKASEGCDLIPVKQVVGALYVSYNKGNKVCGAFDRMVLGPRELPHLMHGKDCGLPQQDGVTFESLNRFVAEEVERVTRAIMAGVVDPSPLCPGVCDFCPVLQCPRRGDHGAHS